MQRPRRLSAEYLRLLINNSEDIHARLDPLCRFVLVPRGIGQDSCDEVAAELGISQNIHVRGYKEQGNINTPLELAILNNVSRYNLAMDIIDRVPRLQNIATHTQEWLRDQITQSVEYAHTYGIDCPDIRNWTWPE